jgi:hypothetical protein
MEPVKLDFEFVHPEYGVFRDAIIMPDPPYTAEELMAIQKQRYDDWVAVVSAQTAPPEETPPPDSILVGNTPYLRLTGLPGSGAQLLEIDGVWYYKSK